MERFQGVHDAKWRAWRVCTAAAILAGAVLLVPGSMVRAHDDDHNRFDRDHGRGDAAADLWKSIRKARVRSCARSTATKDRN